MDKEVNITQLANRITEIGKVQLKAVNAKSLKELGFTIVNETYKLIPYDLAVLFIVDEGHCRILNISGQAEFSKTGGFADRLEKIASSIKNSDQPGFIDRGSLADSEALFDDYLTYNKPIIYWQPIKAEGEPVTYALWIESWKQFKFEAGQLNLLAAISEIYAMAAARFQRHWFSRKNIRNGSIVAGAVAIITLFFIPMSLRVVAPCEVVPKDPYYVTAPLDGRLDEVVVDHGDHVKEGDPLFTYDKDLPERQLKVKIKEHEIAASRLAAAENASGEKEDALAEVQILKLESEKTEIEAELLQYELGLMEVKAPFEAVVEIDKPEEWRGKKVNVGEKVLLLYDESKTFIKIYIPVADRIEFDKDRPVKIFLNPMPERSYPAKLTYISSFTEVTGEHTIVFLAEADWIEKHDLKPGLKGSAILYGDKVPLIYWLLRKPLNTLREMTGF